MKTNFLIGALMMCCSCVMAQVGEEPVYKYNDEAYVYPIPEEFSYNNETKVVVLGNDFDRWSGEDYLVTILDSKLNEIQSMKLNGVGIEFNNMNTGAGDYTIYLTQTLFNDDSKYEYIRYVKEGVGNDERNVGFEIVSEDGVVLQTVKPDVKNGGCSIDNLFKIGDNYFLTVYYWAEEEDMKVEYFYSIDKKSPNMVKEVMSRKMSISSNIVKKEGAITINFEDEENVARELVVTDLNGRVVETHRIVPGQKSVQVNASRLKSGMFNFTLRKNGQTTDNEKVIVR